MVLIRIGDVDIDLQEGFSQLNLDTCFFEAEDDPVAECKIKLWWEKVKGKASEQDIKPRINLESRILELPLFMDYSGKIQQSSYYVKRYLSIFAHMLSSNYNFIHSGGIRINDKGLLIIGKSGLGKSTLVSSFSEVRVLDDDMIMTNWIVMKRVCKFGEKYFSLNDRRLNVLYDDFYSCPLDYIVVLTKKPNAPRIRQILPRNIPEASFDDRLPQELFLRYVRHMSLPICTPIYEVNTNYSIEENKRDIESLVK